MNVKYDDIRFYSQGYIYRPLNFRFRGTGYCTISAQIKLEHAPSLQYRIHYHRLLFRYISLNIIQCR